MMDHAPNRSPERLDGFAGFLAFVWRHRRLCLGVPLLAGIVTLVVVLLVPVRYTARTTVMPPEESSTGLMSMIAGLAGGGLAAAGLDQFGNEAVLQEGILRSERMADRIAERFDLDERYHADRREDRLKVWHRRLGASLNRFGLLSISFTDRDPEFAVEVVQELTRGLDEFNREYRTTSGRRSREFLEGRLEEIRGRLAEREDRLVTLQSANASLAISPTSDAVISAGADLLVERYRLQMQRDVLRRNLSADAPAVREIEARLEALDAEMGRLPELNTELARVARDVTAMERSYAFLVAQLEEARVDEARDTPTLQVLDPPRIPERKSWPRRGITILLVGSLAFLASLGLAAFLDAVTRLRAARGALDA